MAVIVTRMDFAFYSNATMPPPLSAEARALLMHICVSMRGTPECYGPIPLHYDPS